MTLYGRDDLVWDELAQVGLEFLVERARLRNLPRIPSSMPLWCGALACLALTSAAPTSAQRWAICCI